MTDNYIVLSRKWRPQSFNDVVGQLHVTQTLQNALKQNRLGHGYLFTGSRGVGKTSVARILSRAINCTESTDANPCNKCSLCIDILNGNNFDVVELDGASNRGIDEIRDLRESVKYAPSSGKYKIYIIDEVHMLTKEAFNALLKTLEEPPSHVLFVLATTDPHKIPQTILSRTQRFNFKRISIDNINNYLSKILNKEGKVFDDTSLRLISKKADGSMRDALSLLDQVIAYCDDEISVETVSEAIGLIDSIVYSKLLFFILKSDLSEILNIINNSLSVGHSINDFTNGFIDFLNRCMHFYLKDDKDEIFFDKQVKSFLKKIENSLDIEFIIQVLDSMLQFQNKLKFLNQPMIALEAQFIKLAYLNKQSNAFSNENEIFPEFKKNDDQASQSVKKVEKQVSNEQLYVREKENDDQTSQSVEKVEEQVSNEETSVSEKENNDQANQKKDIVKLQADNKEESDKLNMEDKSNSDTQNNSAENKSVALITLDSINEKWATIISLIQDKNPKTSSFLNNVVVESFENKKLTLSILNGSQFHINSLENDINIINDSFSECLGDVVNVHFQIKSDDNFVSDKESKPKQHPLIDKAIDLLDGEIIK